MTLRQEIEFYRAKFKFTAVFILFICSRYLVLFFAVISTLTPLTLELQEARHDV
ncbi:hypothetical protein PHLGIDRAFT_377189 [Phlebiopsis gigantea 11061_1 CR5-6]|uniref:Uncharacterized protein n=1 Tax=Phlebiopsis gigantea (strain 11061_1 CR5-6) TaxID=745531 RepID=A0A0C3P989_PHLG1|nr:hypothetical protein PHLGIDRAFT_377189 [Phlebiopsis gigantea 11061_1 CR5-6]